MRRALATALIGYLLALPAVAAAEEDIEPDEMGVVLDLPDGPRDHWLWVNDKILRHNVLFDGDTGRVLGTLDVAWSLSGRLPMSSPSRAEFYVVETMYSRGHRGTRSDLVTIYDANTLAFVGEIEIPPLAAETGHSIALTALLDGGRFLAVFNQSPGSVSIVDVESRKYVGSVDAAGCALIYPTGQRSFGMLCGDGTAMQVFIDEEGREQALHRSDKFFDVVADPLTEKGVRDGEKWLFSSFEGWLHEIDFSADAPRLVERWSLFSDPEREAGWRVGGVQHLALHEVSGRLYSLVHKGGPGSHKDPGSEIWVYDVASHDRLRVIPAPGLLLPFVRSFIGIEKNSLWYTGLSLLAALFPSSGVHTVVVTQDEKPLLFVRHSEIGAVGVIDAETGAHLRDIDEVGITGGNMATP